MSECDRERVYGLAVAFRRAIEATPQVERPVRLENFPRGSCGDATVLLGRFLRDSGCGQFDYILGERRGHSHAWIERGGLIVDITADQFEGMLVPVFVSHESPWHKAFDGVREHSADFENFGEPAHTLLAIAYQKIVTRVVVQ